MVFVAEAFAGWLVGQAAAASTKRLGGWLLGGREQQALREAAIVAIEETARLVHPLSAIAADQEGADHLARVIDQVFQRPPTPTDWMADHATLLQGLQADVAAHLAVLGDAQMTGTGQSSAELLGVSVSQLTDLLISQLLKEIRIRGVSGRPLTALADQLNHDLTHLQGQQQSAILAGLATDMQSVLTMLSPLDHHPQSIPARATRPEGQPAFIYEGSTVARLSYRHEVGHILSFYTKLFAGREPELAKTMRFGGQQEPGYALVEAPAGYGKSAFVAQMVHRHESGQWSGSAAPALVFFFVREEGSRHTPEAFCLAVNSQLLDLLELPGGVPAEFEAQRSQLTRLWSLAVESATAARPMLLVVDGLDEIAPGRVTINDLLPTDLGSYVHVVVTSRTAPEPFSQFPLEHPFRQAEVTRLYTLDDGDVAALLEQQGGPVEFAHTLARRVRAVTKGEPLVVRFVAEEVVTGGEGVLERLERNPPAGVKHYFRDQFRRLESRAAADTVWKVLGLLLVARGAITVEELAGVLDLPKREVSQAIAPIRRFLLGDDGLELMHLELRAILAEQFSSDERLAYETRLLSWCGNFQVQGWPADTPNYVLEHYVDHLLEVGNDQAMYSLVDRRFMELQAVRTHSHQAFARNVLLAVQVAASEEPPNIVQEVRGLLVRAGLNSTAANVPLQILAIFANTDQIDRAMGQAALISDPRRRSDAYLAIAEAMEEQSKSPERQRAFDEAALSASCVADLEEKASTFASLSKSLLGVGEQDEAIRAAHRALQVANELPDHARDVFALSDVAEALALAGEFNQALALAQTIDSSVRKAHLLGDIAKIYVMAGQLDRALQVIAALDLSPDSLAVRVGSVSVLLNAGEHTQAVQQAMHTLRATEPMIDGDQKAFILASAARALAEAREDAQAVEVAEQALRSAEAADSTWRALVIVPLLADAMLLAADKVQAQRVVGRALQIAESISNSDERASARASVAKALVQLGERAEAMELAELTLPDAETIDDPEQQALTLIDLLTVPLAIGDFRRASEVISMIHPNAGLKSRVSAEFAYRAARAGKLDIAFQAAESLGSPREIAYALAAVAEALTETGNPEQAEHAVERAFQAAESLGDPGQKAYALAGAAEALLEAGEPELAERVADRAFQAAQVFANHEERACGLAEVAKAAARVGGGLLAHESAERALQAADLAEQTPQDYAFWLARTVETLIEAGQFEYALRAAEGMDRSVTANVSLLTEIADAFSQAQQFEYALQIAESLGDPVRRAYALADIGFALAQFGKHSQASELAEHVLHTVEMTNDAHERVILMCGAAKVLAKDIDLEDARRIVHRALRIAQAMDDSEMRILAVTRVLETFVRLGDGDQAISMAYELPDSMHDFALTGIATSASDAADFSSAMAAADGVKDLDQRILALVTIAKAMAEAQDSRWTAVQAERILLTANGLGDVPRKVWALETVTSALFRTGNWAQARRSMSATLMAASDTNRSAFLRTLGDLLGPSGEAFRGNGKVLWAIGEAICEIDDWWFTK